MITLPAIVKIPRFRQDKSATLSFITRELSKEERDLVFEMTGLEGWLLFSGNEIQEEDVPKGDADMNVKTHSQRLRGVIYAEYMKLKEQKLTDKTWNEFYAERMESFIEFEKDKLD